MIGCEYMKQFNKKLCLLIATSLLLNVPVSFAGTKSLSLEEAIKLSKDHSPNIRAIVNQEFTTQNTIRKNIQNSYQLSGALDTYSDYIQIYNRIVDVDDNYEGIHPWHKYIGKPNTYLIKSIGTQNPLDPLKSTGLIKKITQATMAGQTNKVIDYNKEIEFIQLYMAFGDNPSLTKESKYRQFKKNEAMLKNSIDMINTRYKQGLLATTKMTESGTIKLYVLLKDLTKALEVQENLLKVYLDGLENMKASYQQGLVSKLDYENQIRTVELEQLKTDKLKMSVQNLEYQLKKLVELPMTTKLILSTTFDNEDYELNMPSTYYERAYASNMDYNNLQAELTYNEKNYELMNKYLTEYDSNKDFSQPIYYQEKIDQQELIDDLKFKIENTKRNIDTNVTLAYNDLLYKAKLVEHNKTLLELAQANMNNGLLSYKLGQITELNLDKLRIQYEASVMTADKNQRTYNKSVENFKLLLDYGVAYSPE